MCSMTLQAIFQHFTSTLINQCSSGNIFPEFLKLLTRKRMKNSKAARETREYEKRRKRKLSAKWEVGRPWLKHDEEKGTICEWCVENKQPLVAQNVLNSAMFYIEVCTSYKNGVYFISREERSASSCTTMP